MSTPTFEDFRASVEISPEEAKRVNKKLIRLTEEQIAVIQSESPAILVVAGAGSGKTATMAQRIAWHVASGKVQPDEVLGLTFTRKAAGELAERVHNQLGKLQEFDKPVSLLENDDLDANEVADDAHVEIRRPTISTYNSFAAEIASSYAMLIGEDPRARLIQDAERWQIMDRIVKESEPQDPDPFGGVALTSITDNAISLASAIIDNGLSTDEVRDFLNVEIASTQHLFATKRTINPEDRTETSERNRNKLKTTTAALNYKLALLDVVDDYFTYKKENSMIEFADQVAWATRILTQDPSVGESLREQYKLILLDEYQDTSINQANFLKLAFGAAESVCAVGDPNQAIYSWRGASANALGDFAQSFRVPVEDRLTLSTAFRNSCQILDSANSLTSSFDYGSLNVKQLKPRQDAGQGLVEVVHDHLKEGAQRRLVARISEEMQRGFLQTGRPLEVAILCRKRSYIDGFIPILEAMGVPYEVMGGEAIINKPEVRLLRALLGLIAYPQRNSLIMPLLNFFAVGTSDIRVLSQLVRSVSEPAFVVAEGVDTRGEQNYPEALEWLRLHPDADLGFSEDGHRRVLQIASILANLRQVRHLQIPRIIEYAIELLDLRAYASARIHGGTRVKNALAGFVRLGNEYVSENPLASLGGFLDRVNLIEAKEHGGEGESGDDVPILPSEEFEPEAGVVQLMTVHAAKGLEWDIVAIPEMVSKQFDTEKHRIDQWHTSKGLLPYPLRQDNEHLPKFAVSHYVSPETDIDDDVYLEVVAAYDTYCEIDIRKHQADEERRLAYVAVTRPRTTLLLESYEFENEEKVADLYSEITGNPDPALLPRSNRFLADMRHHLVWDEERRPFENCDQFISWARDNGYTSKNALAERKSEEKAVEWPVDVDRSLDVPRTGIQDFEPINLSDESVENLINEWELTADLLATNRGQPADSFGLVRDHLTASDVVSLSADPETFMRNQRRPIPQNPSRAARLGNEVHAAIAHFYAAPATLDIDAVADPDEMPIDVDFALSEKQARELFERFEHSPYANAPKLAIEQSLEVRILDMPIRCVIDAVLDTSHLDGAKPITIVDWKTGKYPGAQAVESRRLQLALYRLVWAKVHGLDLEDIDAVFYYLGEPDPAKRELRAEVLTEDEVAQHITLKLEEGEKLNLNAM